MILFEFDRRSVKKIFIRFTIFGIPLLVASFYLLSVLYNSQLSSIKINIEKQQEEIVLLYKYNFDSLFNNIYDDLNVIANSNEFSSYLESDTFSIDQEASKMFSRVLTSKPAIYQLRFILPNGMEGLRVDRIDNEIVIKSDSELQNKQDRYYFQNLLKIENNNMYISDFDLNIENGVIELPYRPTIRFAIPIIMNKEIKGYLVANVNGLDILEVFKDHERGNSSEITLGLLDKNNIITLNMFKLENTLETSFLRDANGQNPIHKFIDYNKDRGRFNFNNDNYFYKLVENKNAKFDTSFDETWGTWTILSSYNEDKVIQDYGSFLVQYPNSKFVVLIMLLILIILMIVFITSRETEHLLLLATGIVSDFSHDGILITNSNKKIIYCNSNFESLFGYNLKDIKGKSPKDLSNSNAGIIIDKASNNEVIWEGNIWDVSSEGIYVQRYLRMRTVRTTNNQIAYYIGIYSEPRISEDEYNIVQGHISKSILNIDTLNYLPTIFNEPGFDYNHKLAVITLRITEYAILRNILSEHEESTLVCNLSSAIKQYIDEECAIFSPSAGLLFLAVTLNNDTNIESIMNRIDQAVSSMRFSERTSSLDYLSGIAISPGHGDNIKQLIENSYIALDAITRIRNIKYLLFNEDIFKNVEQHYQIKNEIDNAYLNDEFSVVYQPQNRTKSGEMIGVEALVRWNSATLGHVPPFIFVPVMEEESNQIKRLGTHMLKKVIEECEEILPLVSDDFRFSVNLSAQEFADMNLVLELIEIINKSNFPPERICFEITETVLSENLNQTNNIINLLHKNNITVAIDDFGTGYSSLGYLKKLNVDKLKVDMLFIKDYPENDDGSIIKAITKLSHEMGVKVIVEGIETEEQLAFIGELGCQEFQGYLSSKPVSIEKITELLNK